MRITLRLSVVIALWMLITLSIYGLFAYEREIGAFDQDMRQNAALFGNALASAVADIWRIEGQTDAMRLLADVNTGESRIHVSWVWDMPTPKSPPSAGQDGTRSAALPQEREMMIIHEGNGAKEALCTYFPVCIPDGRVGAIKLSQSLAPLRRYARNSLLWLGCMAAVLVVMGGLLLSAAGHLLIGKRLRLLVEHARTVGNGNYESTLQPEGRDEIADMENEMNLMSAQLKQSRDRLLAEAEARIDAVEQLRHSERLALLGQLASGMAHELGTPLNIVDGRAKLIVSEGKTPDVVDCAAIIVKQAQRMTHIVRDFLSFARRRTPCRSRTDVGSLARQTLDMMAPLLEEHEVRCAPLQTAGDTVAHVDPKQIQQVLMNLIANGIQAMDAGGRLTIEVVSEKSVPPEDAERGAIDAVVIRVGDTGCGIPPENLAAIYDPFFTTKETGKGTGLGLSIAHGIVEEHDGWMSVESTVDAGTCFSVYLPQGAQA